jgi:SAM-dependent methyltransferase
MTTPIQHAYPVKHEKDAERLANQHEVIKEAMGGLVLAPLDLTTSRLRILDSGTTDGTWIQDLAETCAPVSHEIYGTDIDPSHFPANAPEGTKYVIQDINKPWPEQWKDYFDLVHQRLVLVGAGPKQQEALESLANLVKPGGWIQLVEATNEPGPDCGPRVRDSIELMRSVFNVMGAKVDLTQRLPEWLEAAGFVDVQKRDVVVKFGALNPDPDLAARGVFATVQATTTLAQFAKSKFHCIPVVPRRALD